ncbi:uncharacterized protein LOC8280616 isoform X1 [Ricinus communis]|uniref:Protein ENHANCED DISEASE RESISTANCE 2 C-terminal domain-containing protein n=1 Tax=Ricinus communis TaxID=3988 RepID=B9RUI9_RICCO|nr:uncharacterized protein LOC8280616 isoform X1 [Ricinus communis]EEF44976.1 conserved hypothetical protein [Ricinus communis]|eukprot:XP_002517434.1 uncharacterized protein LOC8280616 [Ricinus communis]
MGGCASRPKGCIGLSSKKKKNGTNKPRIRRRRIIKRRVSSHNFGRPDLSGQTDRSFSNPAFQGSIDAAAWSDAISVLESEIDDEFYSVHEDGFSVIGTESVLSISSPRDFNQKDYYENNTRNEVVKAQVSGNGGGDVNVMQMQQQVEENNCGLLPNICLPCLASTVPSIEKKRSLSPSGTPSSRRKPSLRLSFKWREGHSTPTFFSPKALLQRPIAGSSLPCCPLEKKMPDCWSPIEPSTFKVRGQNYFRDKKKDRAPNCAAFYPFGADLFLSPRKIHHIARYVELPTVSATDEVPSVLVVNLQIPLYPATIFQSENDGEGMSLVMYFKLSENYSKELPSHFRDNINRLINDEVERVRGFPVDTIAPFRERLKILGRLANADELQLGSAEKKLLNAYNEKPVLSRPQHEFYLGESYFEIDLDMHKFSYISRKGFEAFQDRLKLCVLDFGLTIQGHKAEDLPEHMLCCMRLNELDYAKHQQLGC